MVSYHIAAYSLCYNTVLLNVIGSYMNKKETNYEGGADLLSDGAVKNLGNIALRAIQMEVDLAGVPRVP